MNMEATTAKMLLHTIKSTISTPRSRQAGSWEESTWGQEAHPYSTPPSRDRTGQRSKGEAG